MITRRNLLEAASAGAALAGADMVLRSVSSAAARSSLDLSPMLPEGTRAEAALDSLPGKKPLIKLSYRPPNYETPIEYFRSEITPNDAFFVRYHLSDIPEVDPKTWRLAVGGDGANAQLELSLADLLAMPAVELAAVNQCSGNRRGLFQPHVAGIQWGYGGMGCARWKGVRLKDVLEKVGLKKETIEIAFDGADGAPLEKTPDFIKSLPLWKAMEETTLIAYEMNGQPLPHYNGFPARIVVPGWTATYWVKHLTSIKATTKAESGFWMNPAYRIPLGKFPLASRFVSQDTATNTPITEIVVNSLITSHIDGSNAKVGAPLSVGGIAWDGGFGVRLVEVSIDEGRTWSPATLGEDLGRFAFRAFNFTFVPRAKGKQSVMARATNRIGQTQTAELIQNPAGYHHNVMHRISFNVT
jgi:sulfite dehydrogenase